MKRILIADHSEIANRMFCTGLSKCGFLVTAVANVRDLLHQCSIGHYDLLLMDLYLDKTNFIFKEALSRAVYFGDER